MSSNAMQIDVGVCFSGDEMDQVYSRTSPWAKFPLRRFWGLKLRLHGLEKKKLQKQASAFYNSHFV